MMADLGDYITRLICDPSKYVSGTESARKSADNLSGSVNSIIGALERQKRGFETSGRSTLDWINLADKASEETKELARSLYAEVTALERSAAAHKARNAAAENSPILKMMNATHGANDPFQVGLRRMGNSRDSDAAAMARDANDPFLQGMRNQEDPFSRGLRVMGVQNESQAAAAKAAAVRDANDPFLTGMARWQNENDVFTQGLNRLRANHAAEIAERERHASEQRRLARTSIELQQVSLRDAHNDDMMRVRRDRTRGVGLDVLSDGDVSSDQQANRLRAARARDEQEREQYARAQNDQRIRENNQMIRQRRSAEAEAERSAYTSVILPQVTQEEADRDHRRRTARARDEQESRQYAESQNQQAIRERQIANRHARQAENQGRRSGGWMMEGGRAVEDFTQGSVYGGFKGGMLAASNNLSQMGMAMQGMQLGTSRLGQALGNYGGLIGSAISTTVILGTVAVDAWMKSARGADLAAEAAKNFGKTLESDISLFMKLRGLQEGAENAPGMNHDAAPRDVEAKRKEVKDMDAAIRENERLLRLEMGKLGAPDASATDLEFLKAQGGSIPQSTTVAGPRGTMRKIPRNDFTEQERKLLDANAEAAKPEVIDRVKAAERAISDARLVRIDTNEALIASEKRLRETQLEEFKQMDVKKAREDKEVIERARQASREFERQKRKEAFDERNRVTESSSRTMMDLIRRDSPTLADEIERKRTQETQRKSIADALGQGLISADDASMVNRSIGERPAALPGGSAAAVQSGSTAAYSAMVKAFQQDREDKAIAEARKNTQKLVTVLEKIETAAKEPIKVTVKNL